MRKLFQVLLFQNTCRRRRVGVFFKRHILRSSLILILEKTMFMCKFNLVYIGIHPLMMVAV